MTVIITRASKPYVPEVQFLFKLDYTYPWNCV